MKKTFKFKVWKWFIPIFGLFYFIWYAYQVKINKKYDEINDAIINYNTWQTGLFVFYASVHSYSIAFFVAWILSIFNII